MLGGYRNTKSLTFGKWVTLSTLFFFICILLLVGIMMLANTGLVNNIQFPILHSLPLFSSMFEQSARKTNSLFSNKTLIAIGQFDPRSGLYLWTLELDFNSLVIYGLISGIGVWLFSHAAAVKYSSGSIYRWSIAGLFILIFSRTYITVLAHCAGPTWIGFVALYGLGAEDLDITSTWQWFIAAFGFLPILIAVRKTLSESSSTII